MNHKMGLLPNNFEKVKSGAKCREYRLYDEKRQKIAPGDTITFHNTKSKESVTVTVKSLRVYKSFKECYREFWEEDFADRGITLEQAVSDTYQNWWSKDKEEKYGCVVMDITPV